MTITRNVQWAKSQPNHPPSGYMWVIVRGPHGEPMCRKGAAKWQLRRVDTDKSGLEARPALAGT
jgi:hypothetical protein